MRKADEQVNNVFMRRVSVFPPHGLDVEDNFFSVQRPIEDKPGRRYMGICSPGQFAPGDVDPGLHGLPDCRAGACSIDSGRPPILT